ncbi:MAG: hypothetical protein GVX96_04665 [Bacteroidetes bacterium]|jgi:hypothetical protein|nr:hypothetical protein [Bacteroidota bacterium]
MSVLDSVRLLIYRVHEKGLEVFMLNEDERWSMPEGWLDGEVNQLKDKIKSLIPGQSKGAFVSVKETSDKVVDGNDKLIDELKEIISEKNSTKYI